MLNEQYDLEVAMEGSKLMAIAKQKTGWQNMWRKGLSISFRVFTPEAVGSHVRTSGGNISMKNLSGAQDFRTSGGNMDIVGLTGTIVGRTSGGNVVISDSRDDINLETSGGNMDAKRCEGKIQLETSGGNVHLVNIKGTIHATDFGWPGRGRARSMGNCRRILRVGISIWGCIRQSSSFHQRGEYPCGSSFAGKICGPFEFRRGYQSEFTAGAGNGSAGQRGQCAYDDHE